jgi:hypothetical protein
MMVLAFLLASFIIAAVQAQTAPTDCGPFTTFSCSHTTKCMQDWVDHYTVGFRLNCKLTFRASALVVVSLAMMVLQPALARVCLFLLRLSSAAVNQCEIPNPALYGECDVNAKCTPLFPGIKCACNAGKRWLSRLLLKTSRLHWRWFHLY